MSTLTGTRRLLRLAVRRDRVVLTIWVAALATLVVASVASVSGIYTTEAEREAVAAFTAANRLARAFDGPAMGSSLGAITMTETFGVLAVLAALMSIQTITRHTRQDEETGRAELIGSAVVGHNARLAAALLLVTTANTVLAVTTTVVLLAQGLPLPGSFAAGAALGAVGMTFAAIAAVTAQVAETQRAANGLAGLALGVTYLLRAVGDAAGEVAPSGVELISAWPSWLSPIGWGQQLRPFGEERWEVFALFAATVAVGLIVAFLISARRDLDGAVLATRPGPASAEGRLRSPVRLAWRLHRSVVAAWVIGVSVFAAAFGALGDGADELVGLSEELAAAFEQMATDGTLVDAFIAFTMGMVGIAAAGFAVQSALRARNEEASGRLEPLLSTAISRWRWLGANMAITTAGTTAILGAAGVAAGLGYGAATGDVATGLTSFVAGGAVQLPAALVLAGAVFAVFGVAPRLAPGIGWALLGTSFALGQLGELLGLPEAVMNLSPFTHVPAVPAAGFEALPLLLLLLVALTLGLAGTLTLRRRDIVT
jgi:ABC-2 type transport system permease protein